ncbi:MAG: L,D-transpeptidase [candidate division Zixibacteria bacterium]|nr:L,D-transpeptidase [candidate division Zixibacteria bacterium]
MRKLLILLSIPVTLILIAFVFLKVTSSDDLADDQTMFIDTSLAQLPADQKAAKKELDKARKKLAQLKPRGKYIVIDTHANKIALRTEDSVYIEATCSTGSGSELTDSLTGRRWIFNTPLGVFKVKNKLTEPWWRKPDWAFIEENEAIPKNESDRLDPNVMGEYALGFGDGFFIHGTIYERLLGINVTHGCVRVGTDDLKKIYDQSPIGTPIYIF